MDKDILKGWLLNKTPGVYSTIIETYKDAALSLKPSLFIKWLAIELNMSEDGISSTAINSALKRYRSRVKAMIIQPKQNVENSFRTDLPEKLGFK